MPTILYLSTLELLVFSMAIALSENHDGPSVENLPSHRHKHAPWKFMRAKIGDRCSFRGSFEKNNRTI